MTDLVSVVIPSYNYGRFLPHAIDSVLSQTYPRIEGIVVDDGSQDNTREILQVYGSRIRVIHQPNKGLSAARNSGIAAARGAYVAFLDADDWWMSSKIACQVELLARRPGLGCVGCGREHVHADGTRERFPGMQNQRSREETLRALAVKRFWVGGSGSGAMVRRSALDVVGGFDERLAAAEDWDMWMRLAYATEIDNVPEILTAIRRHRSGVFRNVNRMEENSMAVYDKAIGAWPGILSALDRKKMRALILADAGGEWVGAGDQQRALASYARSLAVFPFHRKRWRVATSLVFRSSYQAIAALLKRD